MQDTEKSVFNIEKEENKSNNRFNPELEKNCEFT